MSPFNTRNRPAAAGALALVALTAITTACGADLAAPAAPPPAAAVHHPDHHPDHHPEHSGVDREMDPRDRAEAMVATAGYQDVATAEAAGYASTVDTLGCFQQPGTGGMGLHYLDADLLDATVDAAHPEAMVYELGLDGEPIGLVAHEYIVPLDAWTSRRPPRLFGTDFHRHPTLPLWVLHTWLWKDNPAGVFADWNPAVRLCPPGVPVFGVDLPAPTTNP